MNRDSMQLQGVEMEFTYTHPSGKETVIKASINDEGWWEQWGAPREELSENVSLIEQITEQVSEYLIVK